MKQETIAVDFDGVVHDHKNKEPKKMGLPIEGAREGLIRLRREYSITIHCVWAFGGGIKVITDWLNFYNIPFDDITNIKPQAKYYLDDKAIRFTNWPQALRDLK